MLLRKGAHALAASVTGLLLVAFAAAPSAFAVGVGVEPDTSWGIDDATAATTIGLEQQAGVEYAREGVDWSLAEPTKGEISTVWTTAMDALVRKDLAAGIKPVMLIMYPPHWASADPNKSTAEAGKSMQPWVDWNPLYKPAHFSDYANFVRFVVDRYSKMGVHDFEMWNEPNLEAFWPSGVNAAEYTAMLNQAYAAAHSVDPQANVISGGLSNMVNLYDYANKMYDGGARFDRFGYHTYPITNPAACWSDDGKNYSVGSLCSIESLHKVMTQRGDTSKIWLTEMGYSTCTYVSDPTHPCFSEAQQGAYLAATYKILDASYPYVETAIWGFFRDPRIAPDWDSGLGVLGRDFRPKPAYAAMKAYGTRPQESQPPAPTTPGNSGQPAVAPMKCNKKGKAQRKCKRKAMKLRA